MDPARKRRNRWGPIVFLTLVPLSTVVGVPLYVRSFGLAPSEVAIFATWFLATSFAITLGYHRLFAHASFEAHPVVRFLVLFFGAAAFEQSALKWASFHRNHHLYVDTERDPYDITEGFFYAHVGWTLFWKHPVSYANVADLERSRLVAHQHAHYRLWSLGAGVALPLAIGFLAGRPLGALLLGVGARVTLVLNSAFFINSFAHTFGAKPFDRASSARDHWLGALLTNGEGYHNFHHCFPQDYRNGARWWQWDPTKWAIWLLSRVGLAWELRATPAEVVEKARAAAAGQSLAGARRE